MSDYWNSGEHVPGTLEWWQSIAAQHAMTDIQQATTAAIEAECARIIGIIEAMPTRTFCSGSSLWPITSPKMIAKADLLAAIQEDGDE